ncbi:MAG: efflux RND transporter permease subunit [Alphaproteobacteria bacterium]|nr:efflux RND transporter permease subunit [Alphaproteobacteria bacterium]
MNVSAWSIRHPIPALVLFLVLMVLGWTSFYTLPITRFPNIDVPVIQVLVTQSGAAPSELETQVSKKVEDAVAGITGVKHQTSTITEGSSVTMIEFRLEVDADRAINDVKDAVARIRSDLPRTIDEPIIQRIEIEGLPIVTYAVRDPSMSIEELSWFVDDTIKRRLQSVNGVSAVDRIGGVTREVHVTLDPDRLLSLGITAGQVNAQLRATNVDLAGGRGEIANREQAIRTLAGKKTIDDLAATSIALPAGRNIRLDELGSVTDTWEEPRTFAVLNGESVVAFAVSRGKGASDTTVADAVTKEIASITADFPNAKIERIDNTVDNTFGTYEATMKTLMEGAGLAILVVFLFLRDLRATVIAAIALPLSIIPTFWAMEVAGFSLNLVSLLSITIVTGILVDDAIVEIENIVRHTRMGKSAYRASMEAADEIGLAVIAITVTIIAVFVPVSFMGGIAGQYFKQFGLTVAFAVFFSLLVARLITPLLAAYFMRQAEPEHKEGWLNKTYTRLVGWTVRRAKVSVGIGLLVFAGSVGSFYLLPNGFLPVEDLSRSLLGVELPPGSRLEDTRDVTARITKRLKQNPNVKSVFVNGGTVLGSGAEVRKATLIVALVPKHKRDKSQAQVQEDMSAILAEIPDIRYWFLQDNGQRQFQLVVTGPDAEAVERVGAELTSQAKRVPALLNVVSTAELDRPELRVYPKSDLAADLGVSTQAISEAVRVATIGDIGANLAKFDVGNRQIPIRVKLPDTARSNRQLLETLQVQTDSGTPIPLSAVASFELSQGPTAIDRYDRNRRILIGADLVGDSPLGDAINAVLALPAAKNLPDGVEVKQFGDAEIMVEVFQGFATAMGAGIMMVYAVLVLLFSSFLQPVTILFSLPLSIGGAIVALALTGNPISLPVVIGILMLMGIVTKNAIMLVDFAIEQQKLGTSRNDAIIDAGRKRARPIVMTTIAMVGGMVPSALALDAGGEFRAPMAIAVIGGLISSTVLSLLFVPAVYVVIDDIGRGIWRLFSRFVGAPDETGDPPTNEGDSKTAPAPAE